MKWFGKKTKEIVYEENPFGKDVKLGKRVSLDDLLVPSPSAIPRILILGATGFVGRNMVERFAANPDYEVHAHYHLRPLYHDPAVLWVKADLREPFDFSGYDIVIHAAATTSGSKDIVNNPAMHVTDNAVMGSLIFRAAAEAKVRQVIFFSCTTMFTTGRITEDSPLEIPEKYFGVAHTKLYLEKMAEFYSRISDTRFTVIRHSNCYGPHDKYDLEKSHVMGATVTKVMNATDSIAVWGNGEETRDLLYIDDLADFVGAVIAEQPEKFGLYNAGAGHAVSVNKLVDFVIKVSGKSLVVEHDLTKPTIPTSLWLDCSKAKNELGWQPKIGLAEGIERTLKWYKENMS